MKQTTRKETSKIFNWLWLRNYVSNFGSFFSHELLHDFSLVWSISFPLWTARVLLTHTQVLPWKCLSSHKGELQEGYFFSYTPADCLIWLKDLSRFSLLWCNTRDSKTLRLANLEIKTLHFNILIGNVVSFTYL